MKVDEITVLRCVKKGIDSQPGRHFGFEVQLAKQPPKIGTMPIWIAKTEPSNQSTDVVDLSPQMSIMQLRFVACILHPSILHYCLSTLSLQSVPDQRRQDAADATERPTARSNMV